MRLLLYNIRYAAGTGLRFNFPVPGMGYLRNTSRNLSRIVRFIRDLDPDISGLIEVDLGSLRSDRINQAQAIATAIGHDHVYQCKYGERSFNNRVPIVNKQGNAFITGHEIQDRQFHYFDAGIKRLIMELQLDGLSIFLVHLSVKYRHRHYQLGHLHSLVRQAANPVIVAGDFNTFWGDYELHLFMEAAGLYSANADNLPSYPSWAPRRELDFVLYSRGIRKLDFRMPQVNFSDHLPLIFDFELEEPDANRPSGQV
ncbi:MAG: endonuclease/exonuclease/phosphatase family protein [Gammaproteobacteria bacterium]|jgi:endonuclease/exonuclease/phosphatase family metal-dependent hydrolase